MQYVIIFFLPFIYFTSFREQDKAGINFLQWSVHEMLQIICYFTYYSLEYKETP